MSKIEAKRVVFTGVERAELQTFALEDSLEPDAVRVRMLRTLVSTGTELAYFTNQQDIGHAPADPYPIYPGYAAVGVVEAAGAEVECLAAGDRIYASAGHRSHVVLKPALTSWLKLPEHVSSEHGAFIPMGLFALAALCTADIRPGEWLGVVGLGIVGNLSAQIGMAGGMRVVAAGRSALRNERAKACGIDHVIAGSPEEVGDQTRAIIGDTGCRFVLETGGTAEAAVKAIAMAGYGGGISLVGVPWTKEPEVSASALLQPIFSRHLELIGGWGCRIPQFEKDPGDPPRMIWHRHSQETNSKYMLNLLSEGKLAIDPLITQRVPAADAQDAFSGLAHHRDEYLGVVFDWDME